MSKLDKWKKLSDGAQKLSKSTYEVDGVIETAYRFPADNDFATLEFISESYEAVPILIECLEKAMGTLDDLQFCIDCDVAQDTLYEIHKKLEEE